MDENMQLCRICISNSECTTMIPIFGEDLLWKKITMLADVKIEKGDTLPQQVCMVCAKTAISACMFKKKCEDADNFFRHHLQMMRKMENRPDVITISESSDNDPHDEAHNVAGVGGQVNNFAAISNMMLMNGNASSGALNQIDCKNFDLNSVRFMMNNYLMEQQAKEADALAAVNGVGCEGGIPPACDVSMDDEPLPLIPEIELITPQDDGVDRPNNNGQVHGYQCSICYQLFARKLLLKEHMQSCHGRSPPVYECANCKKTYLYKRFLEKHVRRGRCVKKRRNQTRPMECTDCHVVFPTGHHLGWHKRTGCPSRAAKVPLQQLFKQNIVQYNNFPKLLIPTRKPDNALYMQNRRIFPNNSKRKGRTRIKLDANKIALAKHLILKEATTTQIAQELDISRTFAWRLRKNLVNGISLHERFVDQCDEDVKQPENGQTSVIAETSTSVAENISSNLKADTFDKNEKDNNHQVGENIDIKQEIQEDEEEEDDDEDEDSDKTENDDDDDSDDDDDDEDDGDDDDESDDNDSDDDETTNKSNSEQNNSQNNLQTIKHELNYQSGYAHPGRDHMQQVDQTNYQKNITNNNIKQQIASAIPVAATPQVNMHNENDESSDDEEGNDDDDDDEEEEDDDEDEEDDEEDAAGEAESAEKQMERFQQHLMQTLPAVFQMSQQGFSQPVNLSIKAEQNSGDNPRPTKKPRKPNVFIDDEKYATAKILVSQNSSTMEIARQLNVSQMTAWKLRDAIVKGIPLSYRSKRETRPKPPEKQKQSPTATSTPKANIPRRRLKAAERELRDKEITREILEMIKEDSNIQYWKVSARLAEKGYSISPSSVCQKLKALGIHRRWKPGDKPPMLDMDSMKAGLSSGGGGGAFGGGTSTDSFEFNNEQQFELGGAHFLSAFTH